MYSDEDSVESDGAKESGAYPTYAKSPIRASSVQQSGGMYLPQITSPYHKTKGDDANYYSDMDSSGDEDTEGYTNSDVTGVGSDTRNVNICWPKENLTATNLYGDGTYYSDMDDSNNESDTSGDFDLTVNYAEMFPIAESEHRATQIVANRRLEKDRSELVGGRNQDYLGLAREYKFHRQFSDPRSNPPCVLCHSRSSQDVFFPCEHRCVCRECIRKENFCDERELQSRKDGYSICPLCANSIKIIIPFDHGREVAQYWAWVEEVVPPLPAGFKRKFLRSAEVLHDIYVEKIHHEIIEDTLCKQS